MEKTLLELKCKNCMLELDAHNNSKVFFCRNCNLAYNLTQKKELKEFKIIYAKQLKQMDTKSIYFPFWEIETEYDIFIEEGMSKENKKLNNTILVPSFFIKNINYFGDIGYYYFQKEVKIQGDNKRDFTIFPADRNLNESVKYPELYILKHYSSKPTVKNFKLNSINYLKANLILIPFYFENNYYFDSQILWKYPSGALI